MFRKAKLLIIAVVLLFTASQAHAVLDKDVTSSGHILPGENGIGGNCSIVGTL